MTTDTESDEFIEWRGTRYKTSLASHATGGAISIVDSVSPPHSGPPRHVHHDADETFFVLSGDVTFWMEGETANVGPGGTMFVPRGKEHTFRVSSDVPSRHLVILTPGGFEGFFEEMAAGQFRIPEEMAQIVEIAERYHLSFTGPPLDGTK
ncbi:cupin domain-containing protein [Yoonia litorea]|uniref:Cupin domain-containing protein n=1 Tax=Yoonia litorea TaxID=1123755 RepID=A0A1I6MTH3_9RHOB|nr:cupin domain-containing protein [Yoonia litorea]SFS19013.1 Cupin domain-containing protein [Yoonia litorea]